MRANGHDVAHVTVQVVDSAGHPVPDADKIVRFGVKGAAELIGTENGDVRDLTWPKSKKRRTFKGKVLALLQAGKAPGAATIVAQSEELAGDSATLPVPTEKEEAECPTR